MSTYVNNLFNFSRSLPEPFDKLANKKISISSKYGDGTTATLCSTVIKASKCSMQLYEWLRTRRRWSD